MPSRRPREQRQKEVAAVDRSPQVRRKDLLPCVEAVANEGALVGDARAVDQQLRPAVHGLDLLGQLRHPLAIADISDVDADSGGRLGPELPLHGLETAAVGVHERQVTAAPPQLCRQGSTDTAGGSRDDRHLASQ